jgi:hypothetical protein
LKKLLILSEKQLRAVYKIGLKGCQHLKFFKQF